MCFYVVFYAACGALSPIPNTPTLIAHFTHRKAEALTRNLTMSLFRRKHFHSHLDISVLVGISLEAVLFSVIIVLRGSNNKHILLKCTNCNENKNNNKSKQLQHSQRQKSVLM